MTQIDEQRSRQPIFTGAQIVRIAADKCEQRHRIHWTYYLHGSPILTREFLLADAVSAFEMSSDRSKAMKVSLVASVRTFPGASF